MAFKQSLCELFTQPGATIAIFALLAAISLDIASPALSLFGFFELRDLLNHVADLRLILPLYADEDLTFLGFEADRAARNRLQAQWLARECAKWIRERTEVRASSTPLPQSAYLARYPDTAKSWMITRSGLCKHQI